MRKLIWHLFPYYLLVTVIALVVVTGYATSALHDFYVERTAADLVARALLLRDDLQDRMSGDPVVLDAACRGLARQTAMRITIVRADGAVMADSDSPSAQMNNHAGRPEVAEALAGRTGRAIRFSDTKLERMMYVAVPVWAKGRMGGVVRVALPIAGIDRALAAVKQRIMLIGLAMLVVAALVSLWVSRRITRPIENMRQGAERFARGELDFRLPHPDSEELAALAGALNQMAGELGARLDTIRRQHDETAAVFSSMGEGVLALDNELRVLSLNAAAARMIGADPDRARGRDMLEVIRNSALLQFAQRLQKEAAPQEDDVNLSGERERHVQARGNLLRNPAGLPIGMVIVLNDVTRLRRLETVRRDFVANVSHELKTPVTSIRGFVETLLDGEHSPQDTQRFLGIILKQVQRLQAIIEDLLNLSRIEQEPGHAQIEKQMTDIGALLQAARENCRERAETRRIVVEIAAPANLRAMVNADLLEQAIVNLLDNAIKYSPETGIVTLRAGSEKDLLRLDVEDHGGGIPAEHLPRLFERFYRVNKARSRQHGGTGLGLAIVKHIAEAHGGRAQAESRVGQGSIFSLLLPPENGR